MSLPIVETPRYELTLPSTDMKVQYRPFLVKEEKILYIALESGDEKQMQQATKDILKSVTFDKLDVEELPTFDVEYIFLQVRAKSVGEIAKFKVICPDDKKTYGDVEVDISKVEVQVDDAHTNNVILDEERKLGVVMKYPNMKVLYTTKGVKSLSYEDVIGLIINCVDYIYEGEKNYPASESTSEELKTFFEALSQNQFVKLRQFFDTMPRLRHETKVKNPKTGVESTITFSGLQDFFSSLPQQLEALFEVNFALMQHHKYSLSEIEAMIPWERDIYVQLLINWIKEENERKRKEREKMK